MKEQIKILKRLSAAYKCALEFDNCPGTEEIDYITENLFEHNKDDLYSILEEYEGFSCSDIESRVFSLIDEL